MNDPNLYCRINQWPFLLPILDALDDAKQLWHQCKDSYHNPKQFQSNLRSLIQALRNVTFRVQAHKSSIPVFNEWYEPWQTFLKQDEIMKWVQEARNQVVKRKGLSSASLTAVEVIFSYENPFHYRFEAGPYLTTQQILDMVAKLIPANSFSNSLVIIHRLWISETLPGRELLMATAEAFRLLLALCKDLAGRMENHAAERPQVAVDATELPPDMKPGEACFRFEIDVAKGSAYEFPACQNANGVDRPSPKKRQKESDLLEIEVLLRTSDPMEFARTISAIAIRLLRAGGSLVPMLFLQDGNTWKHTLVPHQQDLDKYALWHRISWDAASGRLNAFVLVSETWVADANTLPHGSYKASESKKRKEALIIYAETKQGKTIMIDVPYRRVLGRVVTSEPVEAFDFFAYFAIPVREAWERSVSGGG